MNVFIGILAGGSIIHNTMDQFSDLDLILVYDSTFRDDIMMNRLQIASAFGHLLSGFTGEHVGEPRLLICLYNSPILHVDLKFVTIEEVKDGVEKPIVVWQRNSSLTQLLSEINYSFLIPIINGLKIVSGFGYIMVLLNLVEENYSK